MVIATWKAGFESIHKANAQLVAEEIASIGDEVTPQQIVDAAKDEGTELHKCFEWDNDKAADKFRLFQARQVVCHLVIKQEEKNENVPEVRVFLRTETTGGYKPTEIIVQRQDEYRRMLAIALNELRAFKRKYGHLKELEEICELIN